MWRIGQVGWYTVLLAMLGVLSYFSFGSAVNSYEQQAYRDILGDGTALALFALVAWLSARRVMEILRCPSHNEWRRRVNRDMQMYL